VLNIDVGADAVVKELERIFGRVLRENNGELRVNCPRCLENKGKRDTNFKLYINPNKGFGKTKGFWNCFRCNYRGRGLIKLGLQAEKLQSNILAESELIASTPKLNITHEIQGNKKSKSKALTPTRLPIGFRTDFSATLVGRNAYSYLRGRGLTQQQIINHKIGYVSGGRYRNTVVFPVFNMNGDLIYWVARSVLEKRYLNCPGKNSHVLFNFKNQRHIVLCEGIFDALAVGKFGVALLGKILKKDQQAILLNSNCQKLTVLLDQDAFAEANEIAKKLSGHGIEVAIAFPPSGKDAGEMEPQQLQRLLEVAWQDES